MMFQCSGPLLANFLVPALLQFTTIVETWALKKAQEKKLEVAAMRMLRWMCAVTKLDKIRNERIRGTTKVGEITKKVQERRLKWYGRVMRREEPCLGRRVIVMKVQGRRKRGRTKRRWLDKVKDDIKEKGLSADDVYDRATWRRMSVVCMRGRTSSISVRLKYRDYDVTPHIILILSLTLTPNQ